MLITTLYVFGPTKYFQSYLYKAGGTKTKLFFQLHKTYDCASTIKSYLRLLEYDSVPI